MALIEYSTGGGVVLDGTRMLLLERPQRQEIRLPKGHIDPGESARETALRETAEESGYNDLEILADLGVQEVEFDYHADHYRRQEHYFVMRLCSHIQTSRPRHDAAQFRVCWVEMEKAPHLLTYPAEQTVARAAMRWAQQNSNALQPRTDAASTNHPTHSDSTA